jgi:hypothetical protein
MASVAVAGQQSDTSVVEMSDRPVAFVLDLVQPCVAFRRPCAQSWVAATYRSFMASEVSPDLISRVIDAVLKDVREWRNRRSIPLIPSSSSTRSG